MRVSHLHPTIRLQRGRRSVGVEPVTRAPRTQSLSTAPVIVRLSRSQRARIGPGKATETVFLRGVLLASRRIDLSPGSIHPPVHGADGTDRQAAAQNSSS